MSSTEIIDRDLHAHIAKFKQLVGEGSVGLQKQPLGNLHHDDLRGQAEICQMGKPRRMVAALTLKLLGVFIDADSKFRTL